MGDMHTSTPDYNQSIVKKEYKSWFGNKGYINDIDQLKADLANAQSGKLKKKGERD